MLELTKYSVRPEKKVRNYITSAEVEIRDKYSDLLQWEYKKVCGWTRGMKADEMYILYKKAMDWGKNPPALLYILLKERKAKLKEIKHELK